MSYDANEHVKDVFAHFGLAYYLAGVFETGVVHALLTLDYLDRQADNIRRAGRGGFDHAAYEAGFDAFYAAHEAKTLGNLVKRLHELTPTDGVLRELIARAKGRRDFLAHHFWRERAEAFGQRKGREAMLAELQQDQQLFQEADRQLSAHIRPHLARVGMPPDVLDRFVETYLQKLKDEEEEAANA